MGIYVGHDVDGHSTIEPFASTNGGGNERKKHFLSLLFFLAVLLPALVGCGISGTYENTTPNSRFGWKVLTFDRDGTVSINRDQFIADFSQNGSKIKINIPIGTIFGEIKNNSIIFKNFPGVPGEHIFAKAGTTPNPEQTDDANSSINNSTRSLEEKLKGRWQITAIKSGNNLKNLTKAEKSLAASFINFPECGVIEYQGASKKYEIVSDGKIVVAGTEEALTMEFLDDELVMISPDGNEVHAIKLSPETITTKQPVNLDKVRELVSLALTDLEKTYEKDQYVLFTDFERLKTGSFNVLTSRSKASSRAQETYLAAQQPGNIPTVQMEKDLRLLCSKDGFFKISSEITFTSEYSVSEDNDGIKLSLKTQIEPIKIIESAPSSGKLIEHVKSHFLNHDPLNYSAKISLEMDGDELLISSHGFEDKKLNVQTLKELISYQSSILYSAYLITDTKKGSLDALAGKELRHGPTRRDIRLATPILKQITNLLRSGKNFQGNVVFSDHAGGQDLITKNLVLDDEVGITAEAFEQIQALDICSTNLLCITWNGNCNCRALEIDDFSTESPTLTFSFETHLTEVSSNDLRIKKLLPQECQGRLELLGPIRVDFSKQINLQQDALGIEGLTEEIIRIPYSITADELENYLKYIMLVAASENYHAMLSLIIQDLRKEVLDLQYLELSEKLPNFSETKFDVNALEQLATSLIAEDQLQDSSDVQQTAKAFCEQNRLRTWQSEKGQQVKGKIVCIEEGIVKVLIANQIVPAPENDFNSRCKRLLAVLREKGIAFSKTVNEMVDSKILFLDAVQDDTEDLTFHYRIVPPNGVKVYEKPKDESLTRAVEMSDPQSIVPEAGDPESRDRGKETAPKKSSPFKLR